MSLTPLQPEGWPTPRGYSNGMMGEGRILCVGGQVGWDSEGRFPEGFVAQTRQALENIVAVLRAGGAGPEHVARLTWYVLDIAEYRACLKELGAVYREVMGKNFPAMALVQVAGLVEPEARLEIEATAIV
ncbi:RidA family protein [Teichococcus cervicalis]|uniref:Endoribonuclease L-PSP n=1 Tax=Pseudoroseomonas cervicalis ATCC 49957 TaxID=525371 RepID=D5RRE6_9PROT|nr:RidA family protein [Pseudoroseomonas cervicalis]EFH10128.1 endoribonuclease L-PSP [Pseudoroseomonas cervicalis ATCC 49957]WBV41959.1 RidA family protein [Pseudoroseomonas cervicalis]